MLGVLAGKASEVRHDATRVRKAVCDRAAPDLNDWRATSRSQDREDTGKQAKKLVPAPTAQEPPPTEIPPRPTLTVPRKSLGRLCFQPRAHCDTFDLTVRQP
jgi:hypothetical protein